MLTAGFFFLISVAYVISKITVKRNFMLRIEILSHIYLSQNSCDGRIKFGFVLYRQGSHNMEQLTFFYSKLQKLLLSLNI